MPLNKTILAGLCIAAATATVPATAQDKDFVCDAFGSIGYTVATVMLPVTMQELVDMTRGQNPDLLGKITQGLTANMAPETLAKFTSLPPKELDGLSQLAGAVGMQTLMSGGAGSPDELQGIMARHCRTVGPSAILQQGLAAAQTAQQQTLK